MLIASSRTDSVKAYDAKTGIELWSFYTNGPVRLAPAISGVRACFGSDDGCLYCVELTTGDLHWKHQAVPSQRCLLGNKRLISVWPVRGGPVVADGVVYFAAGVWPFEGVFVYAMEIETGNVLWRNDRLGYMFGQQPHNTRAIGGLAPQGYLLINGDELIVPCSNAYPASLNRRTGELISFELPSSGKYPGGWFATLDPDKARAVRRGLLTFDEVINRHEHEGGVKNSSGGVAGLSREIRTAETTLKFDQKREGVDGVIHSMVVADNALFVTTRDGHIMCFRGASRPAPGSPAIWNYKTTRLSTSDEAMKTAKTLVESSAGRHGIAIVAGLSDGTLTKALIGSSDYHVVVFDDNHDRIQQLRSELDEAGLYGLRAAVIHSDLQKMKLPPFITTTLISERSDVTFKPLLQTLRPFGGNPLTGETEARTFPKTYGCDGGMDYGDFYTLRSGTAAYYDKTIESGTVFLSGPRSGCTNSIIPSGGLLNVPYYYDGCTCSYPLPTAMSLVAMPESHEQWSSWGESKIEPGKIQRIGINFGAPGDRMTRNGTLWLDYPSVGGPSPDVDIEATASATYRYRHSVWMQRQESYPWVSASMAEGLKRFVIRDLRPGSYRVRLHFAEPVGPGRPGPKHRLLDIKLQGKTPPTVLTSSMKLVA
ncbi:MAG: PQQ-binding-like beta-propeller repeat protein [Fuerstiella sp.]|nr:PQQ-binding-like beta-propeller repeat protein [Fuerstiella sp.]MCP4858533.1 PQQ-binding-like beta-propeller repeat protein [Fuerstiella sp.]